MKTVEVVLGRKVTRKEHDGKEPYKALIDAEDAPRISKYNWFFNAGYAFGRIQQRDGKVKRINMARFIMDCPDDKLVDHINRNTLDNRKSNLRIVTQKENLRNRSNHTHLGGNPINTKFNSETTSGIRILTSTHQQLKAYCAINSLFLSATVDEILRNFVELEAAKDNVFAKAVANLKSKYA